MSKSLAFILIIKKTMYKSLDNKYWYLTHFSSSDKSFQFRKSFISTDYLPVPINLYFTTWPQQKILPLSWAKKNVNNLFFFNRLGCDKRSVFMLTWWPVASWNIGDKKKRWSCALLWFGCCHLIFDIGEHVYYFVSYKGRNVM